MQALLALSRAIDWFSAKLAIIATWLVLVACLVSAGNAASRYAFSISSNGWLEVQWYMFAGMVLLGAPYVMVVNEHIRVDLLYGAVKDRTRLWIDLVGAIFFLMPICLLLVYFTWPWFLESFEWKRKLKELNGFGGCCSWDWAKAMFATGETSSNAGGLIRWPVKLLLPLSFGMLAVQGLSEIIKNIAALQGIAEMKHKYQAPLQ
jgi:TRAP-type mannitol/chloroaromatic compound transport system permease small subunit